MTDSSRDILGQPQRTRHLAHTCSMERSRDRGSSATLESVASSSSSTDPSSRSRKRVVRTCSEKSHRIPGARREQQAAFLEIMGDFLTDEKTERDGPPSEPTKKGFPLRFGSRVGRITSRRVYRTFSNSAA